MARSLGVFSGCLAGATARHRDLFEAPSPRPFHYLVVDPRSGGAHVTVRGFDKGEDGVRTLEEFELAYAR